MVTPAFWQGKRVFLTGHTGFKGGWLAIWLNQLGAGVTGYSLPPPTDPSLFRAAGINEFVHTISGDVRDLNHLVDVMQQAEPEIVFHLAAQSLVRQAYRSPVDTYASNVMGTVHLLEAVRMCKSVRAVVVITSDKCYENREWLWGYRENEPMGGRDPYSSSKGCAELVTSAYRQSYFHPRQYQEHRVAIASARAGNVIGGGDWAEDRLIPDCVRAIAKGEALSIRFPHAIRPWQHVLEPLSGYMTLAQRLMTEGPAFAEEWNFGPPDNEAKSVLWLVEKFATLWGDGFRWHVDQTPNSHEAHYLKLDSSKARMHLHWEGRWPLVEALSRVVDWHRAHEAGLDMHKICLEQIKAYENTGN
ncbi:MAG: CDP-glucose 4,6-dehydratase [Kiritimatiellae bacterium]|nr:CDP-glucose 4,6-dehydratase [Kiritimatiellia bacterium]